jgi:hypothetical protein
MERATCRGRHQTASGSTNRAVHDHVEECRQKITPARVSLENTYSRCGGGGR